MISCKIKLSEFQKENWQQKKKGYMIKRKTVNTHLDERPTAVHNSQPRQVEGPKLPNCLLPVPVHHLGGNIRFQT